MRRGWLWLGAGLACGVPMAAIEPTTAITSGADEPTSGATSETDETTAAPLPGCCGCLCGDSRRSCGANTCTPDGGGPAPLDVEAGLLEVPGHAIGLHVGGEWLAREAAASRLWYAFRPAEEEPESRPLAVFFNGGPGNSTAALFGSNTGAWTLDPAVAGEAVIAANPYAWTRVVNVLYVDPPETGYSYDVGPAAAALPFIPEHDAAVVAWFLLEFLAAHPQLRAAPVILVGQSWGGVRAALIGQHLLYAGELVDGPVYRNPGLHAAIAGHLAATAPGLATDDPATAARQFGRRVLIQPVISTGPEADLLPHTANDEVKLLQGCLVDGDPYQCDEPAGWTLDHVDAVVGAIVRPDALSHALSLDVSTIAWLHADARAGARARVVLPGEAVENEDALRALFGGLADGDRYYLRHFRREALPDGFYAAHPGYARAFVRTLAHVRTFVTDAGKDGLVYTRDLPGQLAYHADLVASATHDAAAVGDEARPGRILVTFQADTGWPASELRTPHYAAAGHTVTARAPGELLADVEAWLADP